VSYFIVYTGKDKRNLDFLKFFFVVKGKKKHEIAITLLPPLVHAPCEGSLKQLTLSKTGGCEGRVLLVPSPHASYYRCCFDLFCYSMTDTKIDVTKTV